jgi:uncharacterized protein (DUF2147 family)
MTDSTPDAQLARIRKLLAKAEDAAATPAEAEAFTAKATQLMATYGISRAMVAAADPSSDAPGDRILPMDAPYALDKANLLCSVAAPLRCRSVRRVDYQNGRKEISVHLFGYDSDLDRVMLLFTSLLVQAANALKSMAIPPFEHPAAFRRSWLAGYSAAIHARLVDAEREAADGHDADPGNSVAVVLADRRAVVDRRVRQEYPHLSTGRGRSLSGSGGSAGYAAGQRAHLGSNRRGVHPGKRRAIPR